VRIRLLLFLLVFIVVSGMPPVHAALGIAPRCLPPASLQGKTADAKLPVAELSRELPSYDPEDRDYLIRTIAFEARARGEGQSVSTPSKRPMKSAEVQASLSVSVGRFSSFRSLQVAKIG
jgi:hypothetical protein